MWSNGSVGTSEHNGTWEQSATDSHEEWRDIDRKLRVIAKKRSALDAVEAQLLREADRVEIWLEYGCVSLMQYMERVLGYGPKAAQDRIRVAEALEELPGLSQALARDDLKFTAIRELTRVATPRTEHAWRDQAIGKSLREVECMVSGRQKGDLPTDPPDPDLRLRKLTLEVTPATYALVRQAQQRLETEHGMRLSDDQLAAGMARATLEGGTPTEAPTRATFQIAITQCERCRQGWQTAAGKQIAIQKSAMERAECDAQRIGSLDAKHPERAVQDVPPSVRRLVWARDQGRCQVPGCRSSRHLEVHHIVFRSHGGDHSPERLVLLCDGHHTALHEGKLTITGTAPDKLEFVWTIDPHAGTSPPGAVESAPSMAHVGPKVAPPEPATTGPSSEPSNSELSVMRADVKQALVTLGFKPSQATDAIDDALGNLGPEPNLDELLREALRRCPKGRG
jgi:hypothetical protein